MQKTSIVGTPGRRACSVLSSRFSDGSFTKTHLHCQWQQPDSVETIFFGGLEFTVNCFGNLSISPEGNDLVTIFVGMVHNRSLSLHNILKESSNEGDVASGGGGCLGFPSSQGCNVVTLTIPIATTPSSESTSVLLTILTVILWNAAP
jgi:hypothetical protein